MRIYNAIQLKNGAKAEYNKMGSLMQPVQFLPEREKDDIWRSECVDFFEWQGLKQLSRNAKKLLKNYKLAKGIIDKDDYIIQEDNEMSDLVDVLTKEDESALELKFYPIIPTIINILTNEFSKRTSKIQFRSVDDLSYNEMLEEKRQQVEDVLVQQFQQKLFVKMINAGMDPESEEFQQGLSTENLKTLPEIESFFRKDYRNIYEEWATHQMKVDEERFKMQELEERAFRDMLITDREFWHFRMMENDYEIELWNPVQVAYHKSPSARYISQCNWVTYTDLMTVSDVIDKYGWMMSDDEMQDLEAIYPIKSAGYLVPGYQNDGSYYDATKSHEWNTKMPSLAYRQFMSAYDNMRSNGDVIQTILSEGEDFQDYGNSWLLRVTTVYWKTQRKVGHLTKVTDQGELIQELVSEDYKITEKPLYDTTIYKNKTKDNLVFGEHIDWIWPSEVWGGIKIGPNRPAFWGQSHLGGIQPMYFGINGGKPGRVPFQFKGDLTVFGCKPPVEGCVFSDRNTRSTSVVDLLKPSQIGYNIVNNQIADILVDELGSVVLLDQNALPRKSMGEDWGKNNYAFAYSAMKQFQILPLDTTIGNTENAVPFQHYTKLDLSQTERLLSRVQLSEYFKRQAMEIIGITPERVGQQMSRQSASGVEMAQNASYAQTEHYYIQHSDNLMPRVHQMRTELAQYYHSTNPSVRLQYISSSDEKMTFRIDGTKLLPIDLNVFCTTKTNSRAIIDQLKSYFLNNNTNGASMSEVGNVLKADSIAEIERVLQSSEERAIKERQQQFQQEQQLEQERIAAEERQKLMQLQFEAEENEKDRRNEILVAEIKAAGYGSMQDINENKQSDYLDAMDRISKQQQYTDTMNFKREQESNKIRQNERKMDLDREKLETQRDVAEKQVEVARTNRNKYDKPTSKKK